MRHYQMLLEAVPLLEGLPDGDRKLAELRQAALADDQGKALEARLADMR